MMMNEFNHFFIMIGHLSLSCKCLVCVFGLVLFVFVFNM